MQQKTSRALPSPQVLEQQRNAVIVFTKVNAVTRRALRARFVDWQTATTNSRTGTITAFAKEIGVDPGFIRYVHDETKAFGFSPSGQKLLRFLGLTAELECMKAASDGVPMADAIVSLALFPAHIMHVVFDLKKAFITTRDACDSSMVDAASALGLSPKEFEGLYYANNELVAALDPDANGTGVRYIALREQLDNASQLEARIKQCADTRRRALQEARDELFAMSKELIDSGCYASNSAVSRSLLGRAGALSDLCNQSTSLEQIQMYRGKLAAAIADLEKKGKIRKVPATPPSPPAPVPVPVAPVPAPVPAPVIAPLAPWSSTEEITDTVEQAIVGVMRIAIALLKSQIVFLLALSDKNGMRFGRIWMTLINEIEDLRDHLHALLSDSPSEARAALIARQKERAARSAMGGIVTKKK